MKIEIDIKNISGSIIGDGPIVTCSRFSCTEFISKNGTFSFTVPGTDPRLKNLKSERRIECYVYEPQKDGTFKRKLFADGIVKNRRMTVGSDGNPVAIIEGYGMGQELANDTVNLDVSGGGVGVFDGPARIIARFPGWTLSGAQTTEAAYYGLFAGESGLDALITIASKLGENFVILPGRVIQWLGTTIPASGIRAIKYPTPERSGENENIIAIQSISTEAVGEDLVTRVSPFGSGDGDARLKLTATSWIAPAGWVIDIANNQIINSALEVEIGKIKRSLQFSDITPVSSTDADLQAAANQLAISTYNYMEQHKAEQIIYSLDVAGLKMEKLHIGEMMRVDFDMWADLDRYYSVHEDLVLIGATRVVNEQGVFIPQLTVSNMAAWIITDNQIIVQAIKNQISSQAHPQLGPSCYYEHFNIQMDAENNGKIIFELGSEIVTLNEVCLYFNLDPLESSVKSIVGKSTTSGPSSKSASDVAGSTSQTSSSGGGEASSTEVVWPGNGDWIYTAKSAVIGEHEHGIDRYYFRHSHNFYANAHTHDFTIPGHTHGIEHTHDLTPQLTTKYGIFRNSSANTLALADLSIKANGGNELISAVVALGSGRYKLDLTSELSNQLFRPKRDRNTIVISTNTAEKNCQITANLKVRSVIQAIAYI